MKITETRSHKAMGRPKRKRARLYKPRGCQRSQRVLGDHEDREFEVVKVHNKKVVKGVPYYLLEFKGFGPDQCSYEPIDSCEGCKELIEEYEKEMNQKYGKKRKRDRQRRDCSPHNSSSSESNGSFGDSVNDQIFAFSTKFFDDCKAIFFSIV